ncbi:type I glutamate--ammonia ligase [candidate division WOR-3 bacterium]|nr:type I glutamate--ammonia ligase [candidate division WOR-3 bacterium]
MRRLESAIKEKAIRFLDLKYSDLPGRLRHVTLPIERLDAAVRHGVGFDSSSVAGFRTVEAGDMVLKPDLDSAFVDPFAREPTVSCFAEVYEAGTDRRYERDPRLILARAIAALKADSGAGEVMVRPEFEFYLFNKAEFWTDQSSSVYRIETDELRHDDPSGLALFKGPAYHVAPPFDRSSDFRSELALMMDQCGVPVKYHHHEGGRYSQVEVEPEYLPALRAADGIMLTKYLARNLAFRYDKSVTFMPKPIFGEAGSGLHLHQYLASDRRSLFGDDRSSLRLTRLALHYIGGILEHVPSLCALTNPSTNSYRRLVPGYEAPVVAVFALGNRTAAIRIPDYIPSAAEMAIEYRLPDATANPYLAIAAVLCAGLDGIRQQTEPGEPSQARLDSREQHPGAKAVPYSLVRALSCLKQDSDYLTRDGVFAADAIARWIELKMGEVEDVARRPHPWEFNLYYGC